MPVGRRMCVEPGVGRVERERDEALEAAGLVLQLAQADEVVDALLGGLDVAVEHRAVGLEAEAVDRAGDLEPAFAATSCGRRSPRGPARRRSRRRRRAGVEAGGDQPAQRSRRAAPWRAASRKSSSTIVSALRCDPREARLEGAEQRLEVVDAELGVQAADDVQLGDRLGDCRAPPPRPPPRRCSVQPRGPPYFSAKAHSAHEATQTLVGLRWRLTLKYVTSPCSRSRTWLASRPTREQVVRGREDHAVVERQALACHDAGRRSAPGVRRGTVRGSRPPRAQLYHAGQPPATTVSTAGNASGLLRSRRDLGATLGGGARRPCCRSPSVSCRPVSASARRRPSRRPPARSPPSPRAPIPAGARGRPPAAGRPAAVGRFARCSSRPPGSAPTCGGRLSAVPRHRGEPSYLVAVGGAASPPGWRTEWRHGIVTVLVPEGR